MLSFLKPTGILEGDLAVEPLDLADTETLQLCEAVLVDLAVGYRDMEHHRKLHRHLEQQSRHAILKAVERTLDGREDDGRKIFTVVLGG